MYKYRSVFTVALILFLTGGNLLFCQSWIRINQLGYTPDSRKVAVFVSKERLNIEGFSLRNAFTGAIVYNSSPATSYEQWGPFQSACRLDFTSVITRGTYYIEAGEVKSPVFRISENIYDGTADFLLNYMRQQRCGYNPFLHDSCHTRDGYVIYGPLPDSAHIDVTGGWHDATDYLQYTSTSANAVYQMLLAWQQNPSAFGDAYLANGEPGGNGIPDILDEARWGLEWLVKMNPDSGQMFNQIADDRDHKGFRLPNKDSVNYGKGLERPVYYCTGKPQGVFNYKNRTTGVASTAGKFASAFALGSQLFRDMDPSFSSMLEKKSRAAFGFGLARPGACQTAPCTAPYFYEEDNWTDDMELAGATLFKLTGEKYYLHKAVEFGMLELTTPWMGADTARHYQWYPFLNMGHWEIATSADESVSSEFMTYWKQGLDSVYGRGSQNPFLNGIPFIWCSNNLVVALITQCHLYEKSTGDQTFNELESAMRDWLFGCNPWGTSMIVGMPGYGDYPSDPHSSLSVLQQYKLDGGLVDGPVYNSIYKNLKGIFLAGGDEYQEFQSSAAVYHDDYADYSTNEPTMDGTADLTYYLSALQAEAHTGTAYPPALESDCGAIVRGDRNEKAISLVFTAHEFADGFAVISNVLKKHQVRASFFFTGDFYRNRKFKSLIKSLKNDGHYLGAHSDKHLLYCDWDHRDSLLVTKKQFVDDLKNNLEAMVDRGINAGNAIYFLPPFEWYNDSIAFWSQQYGLKLVNFTAGTSSNQDWTYPAQGQQYLGSEEIYNRILTFEKAHCDGLNGFILLTHFGTDPRRTDKFYNKLDSLLTELEIRGYRFETLYTAF